MVGHLPICFNETLNTNFTNYSDLFYCIDPNFWAYIGIAFSLGISVVGAGWFTV